MFVLYDPKSTARICLLLAWNKKQKKKTNMCDPDNKLSLTCMWFCFVVKKNCQLKLKTDSRESSIRLRIRYSLPYHAVIELVGTWRISSIPIWQYHLATHRIIGDIEALIESSAWSKSKGKGIDACRWLVTEPKKEAQSSPTTTNLFTHCIYIYYFTACQAGEWVHAWLDPPLVLGAYTSYNCRTNQHIHLLDSKGQLPTLSDVTHTQHRHYYCPGVCSACMHDPQ